MKYPELGLPTNRKFGFFFSFVFFIVASYSFLNNYKITAYIFIILAVTFLIITFIKEDTFLPLNKLWMRFGQLLGKIISPIILAIIFFTLITPYSLAMRLFGRDELRLKFVKRSTYWRPREQTKRQTNFKQQF